MFNQIRIQHHLPDPVSIGSHAVPQGEGGGSGIVVSGLQGLQNGNSGGNSASSSVSGSTRSAPQIPTFEQIVAQSKGGGSGSSGNFVPSLKGLKTGSLRDQVVSQAVSGSTISAPQIPTFEQIIAQSKGGGSGSSGNSVPSLKGLKTGSLRDQVVSQAVSGSTRSAPQIPTFEQIIAQSKGGGSGSSGNSVPSLKGLKTGSLRDQVVSQAVSGSTTLAPQIPTFEQIVGKSRERVRPGNSISILKLQKAVEKAKVLEYKIADLKANKHVSRLKPLIEECDAQIARCKKQKRDATSLVRQRDVYQKTVEENRKELKDFQSEKVKLDKAIQQKSISVSKQEPSLTGLLHRPEEVRLTSVGGVLSKEKSSIFAPGVASKINIDVKQAAVNAVARIAMRSSLSVLPGIQVGSFLARNVLQSGSRSTLSSSPASSLKLQSAVEKAKVLDCKIADLKANKHVSRLKPLIEECDTQIVRCRKEKRDATSLVRQKGVYQKTIEDNRKELGALQSEKAKIDRIIQQNSMPVARSKDISFEQLKVGRTTSLDKRQFHSPMRIGLNINVAQGLTTKEQIIPSEIAKHVISSHTQKSEIDPLGGFSGETYDIIFEPVGHKKSLQTSQFVPEYSLPLAVREAEDTEQYILGCIKHRHNLGECSKWELDISEDLTKMSPDKSVHYKLAEWDGSKLTVSECEIQPCCSGGDKGFGVDFKSVNEQEYLEVEIPASQNCKKEPALTFDPVSSQVNEPHASHKLQQSFNCMDRQDAALKPGHEGWSSVESQDDKNRKSAHNNLKQLSREMKMQEPVQNPYWTMPSTELLQREQESLPTQIESSQQNIERSLEQLGDYLSSQGVNKGWADSVYTLVKDSASQDGGFDRMQNRLKNHLAFIKSDMLPTVVEHTQKIQKAEASLGALKRKQAFVKKGIAIASQVPLIDQKDDQVAGSSSSSFSHIITSDNTLDASDINSTVDVTRTGLTLDQVAFAKKHGLLISHTKPSEVVVHDDTPTVLKIDAGVSKALHCARIYDRAIDFVHEKIDNKITQLVKKAYGLTDVVEQQNILTQAREHADAQNDIAEIKKEINWVVNAATTPTQIVSTLAKAGARLFYPPLIALDVPDAAKSAFSVLDGLGMGEYLAAADFCNIENAQYHPEKVDALYDQVSAKHAKILEHIQNDPAAFTKQVVSAVVELGILHKFKYAKTSRKTAVKGLKAQSKSMSMQKSVAKPVEIRPARAVKAAEGLHAHGKGLKKAELKGRTQRLPKTISKQISYAEEIVPQKIKVDTRSMQDVAAPYGEKVMRGKIVASLEHKAAFPKNSSQLKHILCQREGHLADTLANRNLILETITPENFLLIDKYGKQWYHKILEDGSQIWVEIRNGIIRNCGKNIEPRIANLQTGLARFVPSQKQKGISNEGNK